MVNVHMVKVIGVLEFMGKSLTREQSVALLDEAKRHLDMDELSYVQDVALNSGAGHFYAATREMQAEMGWW